MNEVGVFMPQQVFEQNLERKRQSRDVGGLVERGQAVDFVGFIANAQRRERGKGIFRSSAHAGTSFSCTLKADSLAQSRCFGVKFRNLKRRCGGGCERVRICVDLEEVRA